MDDIFEIAIPHSDSEDEDDLDDVVLMHLHNENNIVPHLLGSSYGFFAHTIPFPCQM